MAVVLLSWQYDGSSVKQLWFFHNTNESKDFQKNNKVYYIFQEKRGEERRGEERGGEKDGIA